jgi:hypothetical protein
MEHSVITLIRFGIAGWMILFGVLLGAPGASPGGSPEGTRNQGQARRELPSPSTGQGSLHLDLKVLRQAYPKAIRNVHFLNNNRVVIELSDNKRLVYDDVFDKSLEKKLIDPDLKDMLEQIYPLGPVPYPAEKGHDPGRIRPQEFFKAVYGATRHEVSANCRRVLFGKRKVLFNRRAKAAESLEKVAREVEALLLEQPGLRKYVHPLGGTLSWRRIAGTRRLSPHSFGLAIDLNPGQGFYWRNGNRLKWKENFPSCPWPIVTIFERNGFVWGGKWHHFDSFHFEYRPELILKSQILAEK